MGRKPGPGAQELAEEEARTCCGCRFPLLLALLQLALGIAVTVLGFLMASISPSLLVRDTPFWAGIIVSIKSVLQSKHQRACQPHGGVETNPAACAPTLAAPLTAWRLTVGTLGLPQSRQDSGLLLPEASCSSQGPDSIYWGGPVDILHSLNDNCRPTPCGLVLVPGPTPAFISSTE